MLLNKSIMDFTPDDFCDFFGISKTDTIIEYFKDETNNV